MRTASMLVVLQQRSYRNKRARGRWRIISGMIVLEEKKTIIKTWHMRHIVIEWTHNTRLLDHAVVTSQHEADIMQIVFEY